MPERERTSLRGNRYVSRRTFLGSSAVSTAGVLAGCSGGQSNGTQNASGGSTGTTRDQTTQADEPITTGLAYSHYPLLIGTTPVQVANEKGFFQDRGIDVEKVTSFSGGGTTVRGIVTGGLGAGASALPALIQGYLAGAPIHLVGRVEMIPDTDFEVKPDSPIETIQDCKGKTIAVSQPGSTTEAFTIRSIQRAEGISLDDVEIMHAGGLGEAITAMMEGNADVTVNIPPINTRMLDQGETRRVWHAREYASDIVELVLAMGAQIIDEQPELARGIIEAHLDAFEFIQNNPKETAKIWAKTHGFEEEVAISAARDNNITEMFDIKLTERQMTATAGTMIEQGLIDEQPPWKKIIRQDFLPEDKRVNWYE